MHKYVQKFGESKLQLFTVRFVSLKRYALKLRFVSLKMFQEVCVLNSNPLSMQTFVPRASINEHYELVVCISL